MINPTELYSYGNDRADVGNRFQASSCAKLRFKPKFRAPILDRGRRSTLRSWHPRTRFALVPWPWGCGGNGGTCARSRERQHERPRTRIHEPGPHHGPRRLNSRGGRLTCERAAIILTQVAEKASAEIQKRGQPPLPRVSPHTLRRTYISLALLANNFDFKWVMSQVGHADSKMTMDVYAHLQQRAKRNYGIALDRLTREAGKENTPEPIKEATVP